MLSIKLQFHDPSDITFGAAGWITVARKRSHLLLSHKISNLYRIETNTWSSILMKDCTLINASPFTLSQLVCLLLLRPLMR